LGGELANKDRQKRFCEEYLVDMNGTQAAIRAGYSAKTANEQASRLLANINIQECVSKLRHEQQERTKVNADYVLLRLSAIDQMDVLDIMADDGTIKPISEWPKIWRQYLSSVEVSEIIEGSGDERSVVGVLKKIKWPDKLKNLELLGRHVSVQAFKDVSKVEGTLSVSLSSEEQGL